MLTRIGLSSERAFSKASSPRETSLPDCARAVINRAGLFREPVDVLHVSHETTSIGANAYGGGGLIFFLSYYSKVFFQGRGPWKAPGAGEP